MIYLDYLLLSFKTDNGDSVRPSWASDLVSVEYNKRFPKNSPFSDRAAGATDSPSGHSNYVYPRLQFKVIRGAPMIAAINEGCQLLWDLYEMLDNVSQECGDCRVTEKRLIDKKVALGIIDGWRKYRFLTPWLCLPEEAFKKYLLAGDEERCRMLTRILESNIRSAAQSLGYEFEDQLKIQLNIKPNYIFQRDIHVAGLFGSFLANFEFPSFLGLGKSVSRGFGAIKQM